MAWDEKKEFAINPENSKFIFKTCREEITIDVWDFYSGFQCFFSDKINLKFRITYNFLSFIHTHTHTHTCTHMHTHALTCTHMHTHTHTYTHTCTHMHTHAHRSIYVYIYKCVCVASQHFAKRHSA